MKKMATCDICGNEFTLAGIAGHKRFKHATVQSATVEDKSKMSAAQCKKVYDALLNLIDFATSGRRYKSQNPYGLPEVKEALTIVAEVQGAKDYLSANIPHKDWNYEKYPRELEANTYDSGKMADSVQETNPEIVLLQDSLTKSDAAFLEVKAELADAISYEHERAIVVDFLDKLTPEGKIALSERLGLATVEDSAELEDKKTGIPETIKAYIAGFFDGEGSVNIYAYKSHKNGKMYPKLQVRVSQNSKEVLEWIKEKVGYGAVQTQYRTDENHKKPEYMYQVAHKTAREFLNLVMPYLIVKKEEAVLALEEDKRIVHPKDSEDDISEAELSDMEPESIFKPETATIPGTAPVADVKPEETEDSPGWLWYKEFTKKLGSHATECFSPLKESET